jgi:putative methyltransferase (TIGR04325 family)
MPVIQKIYPSFNSALAECGDAYNDPDIAKVIAFRTAGWNRNFEDKLWPDNVANTLLAVGIAAANLTERPLRVLDFGGGCGIHYFTARSAFTLPLKWAIVETPVMLEHAAPMGAKGNFEVYDEITQAASSLGRVDLVIASGAIQYTPDPMASLDALIALGAPYFALARFPAWAEQTTVGIQSDLLSNHLNGLVPGMPPNITDRIVKCPITFVKFGRVKAIFQEAYNHVLTVSAPTGDYEVLGKKLLGTALIFRRNI